MRKKIKFSSVQACVIDALCNEGAYLFESPYYHWSKVIINGETKILSIHRPTVEFLKRNGIIIPLEGGGKKYILKTKAEAEMAHPNTPAIA